MMQRLKKLGLTYFLNILGLTVALTSFIIIIIQVNYDFGFDNFYKDKDRIFRVEIKNETATEVFYSSTISRPMGLEIAESSPDVELYSVWSMDQSEVNVKPAENSEEGYMRSGYCFWGFSNFEMFEFQAIEGNMEDFLNPDMAVIPQSLAKVLFPNQNAAGQFISLEGFQNQKTIAAVYKDFPENSSIRNLIYLDLGERSINDQSEWSYPLYLKLNKAENKEKVENDIFKYLADKYSEGKIDDFEGFLRLTKVHDIYYSNDVRYDSVAKGNRSTTISLLTIAIFIILIAIINFINLSMATVPLRIKSINTRKVIGCTNRKLIIGQLGESVLLSLISFGLAVFVLYLLKGSLLANFVSGSIAIINNSGIIILTAVIATITGVVAGLYPAVYSTSFPPALVLKGSFSLSPGGRKLRSFLIAFQYVISIALVIVALFIKVQSDYMKKFDMGFRTDHIVNQYISNNIAKQKTAFVNRLKENPNVTDVTFADGPLVSNGKMGWGRGYKGERINFDCLPVDYNFASFFGLKVYEGRDFEEADMQKINGTFIFNRKAAEAFGLSIGETLTGHHNQYPADIVGFIENFNFQPLQYAIQPISLYVMGSEPWRLQRYAYFKIAPENVKATLDYVRNIIVEFDPSYERHINFVFMDEGVNKLYAKEDALATLLLIFCGLSVFISIIGVLGLIFFETIYREKETALRRVLGATASEILLLFNKSYIILTGICFVIASPIAYFIMKTWVKSFAYQAPVPVWIFIASLAIILLITVTIISLRSLRTLHNNPVESIKNE